MTDPRRLSIDDFTYQLPDARIASFPKENRDESKLLIYENGSIKEDIFQNISSYLPGNSLMILNDTRVVEARIIFHKPTGARIEVFCIEPSDQYPDITTALSQQGSVLWKCMVGRSSSWPHHTTLEKKLPGGHALFAKIISKHADHFIIKLSWITEELTFAEVLHLAGVTPLPPYIKRSPEQKDAERYQTVYAHHSGSVAAPTAGLHFTSDVFKKLEAASISYDYVTLHVSAGTFKPVKSNEMSGHDMHAEFIDVNIQLIEKLLQAADNNHPVIAVGTTSLRTLESLYWAGTKILHHPNITTEHLNVTQWQPYETNENISTTDALNAVITWLRNNNQHSLITKTSLLIAPSYNFKIVDILITNFHQPRSTLLLLVAAFIGEDWQRVYTYALENDFRFLSYGDSCLLFRQ